MNYLAIAVVVCAAAFAAGALARRRNAVSRRSIDAGAVSQQWLAESRREEEA